MSPQLARRVLDLRDQGRTFVAIAAELGVTKGQVAGVIFRATSDLYAQRYGDPESNLRERIRTFATIHGSAAAASVLKGVMAELTP